MLYSIHFLRFVAAFVVVVSHSANVLDVRKSISVGDAGVDVFFVISGIVIGHSAKDGSPWFPFFTKRFIRIFPLYWIALTAFVAFRYFEWGVVPSTKELLHSVLLVPEFGTDHFPILFPAWTLSYELLFYLVFGALLATLKRNVSSMCGLIFVSLAASRIHVPWMAEGILFDTQLCAEFAAGLALACYIQSRPVPCQWVGASYCAVAIAMFTVYRCGGENRIIAWGVPSVILLFGTLQFEKMNFLRHAKVKILGDASYSIYLFHIIAMTIMRERFSILLNINLRQHIAWAAPLLIISAVLCGLLVHVLVEKRLLKVCRNMFLMARPSVTASQRS